MKLSIKSDNHKLRNSIGIEDESFDSVTNKGYSCDYREFSLYTNVKIDIDGILRACY